MLRVSRRAGDLDPCRHLFSYHGHLPPLLSALGKHGMFLMQLHLDTSPLRPPPPECRRPGKPGCRIVGSQPIMGESVWKETAGKTEEAWDIQEGL